MSSCTDVSCKPGVGMPDERNLSAFIAETHGFFIQQLNRWHPLTHVCNFSTVAVSGAACAMQVTFVFKHFC